MSRSHRLLVIGVGSIGERHLRCFRQDGRCELAFCEPLEQRRVSIAQRYHIPPAHAFASLEEALAAWEFDCAVVATPAPLHIPIGITLATRGIHILMEKPLSVSLDGVDRFRTLVQENDIVVAVGYVHHAHPAIRGLKTLLASRDWGRLLEIRFDIGQPLPYFRPAYADVYFADPAMGGGVINDMITHFYSVGDALAGPVEKIVTHARHLALPRIEVEDTVHSLAVHRDAMVSYACNLYQPATETTVTVHCERGSLRASYHDKRVSWITEPNGRWHHEAFSLDHLDEIYRYQNNAFLDAVEGRGSVLVDLDAAIRTLRVNLASSDSARTFAWKTVCYES